ncbi:MAG: hypothetical protein JWN80_644 [Microbacteriaceae bacterium]|jgi:hypothetical protein|nr:hypothetical protein [Microbacteriaceae bacterium]
MAVRLWRYGLLLLGLALLGTGAVVLAQEVKPTRYIGILVWFIGALIIHDGIIAPTVFLITVVMRKRLSKVPTVVVAIIQGALVVAGIITLIVVPEVLKKWIGTLSSSILPQNYALHLGLFYAALVLLTALAVAFYRVIFTRRQKLLSSADQA